MHGFAIKMVIALALTTFLSHKTPASAQNPQAMQSDQIKINYVPPKSPEHQNVFSLLKERQVLEKLKEFLSPLRLPRPLLLKTEGCDGLSNAYFENDAVTVCYEYLDEIIRSAPEKTSPGGVARIDAIVGPILDVFFHEVGHAVFDYLSIPILGREEDAADQFAAYILLHFAKEDARKLILGVAYAYNLEATRTLLDKGAFAGEHGLPAQRFYNVLCMAYGSDVKLFADLVTKGYLPKERAEACEVEYAQVTKAMTTLIRPYIDEERAKQVRAKRWLQFDPQ
jgi:hypothetical protein